MSLKSIVIAAALASQAFALSGTILSPFRNTVGPATRAACGTGIANFLEKNPTADALTVASHQDSGYNVKACNLAACGGYQFADSPASKIVKVTTAQVVNLTVIYDIPGGPLDSRDYYELYVPTLSLSNATSGYTLWSTLDYDLGANHTAQVLSHPSVQQLDAYGLGDFPQGACSNAGDCYISYQFVDFFRQPTLVSSRNVYAGCVDVVIDWTGFTGSHK